jgi:hypothetical protein
VKKSSIRPRVNAKNQLIIMIIVAALKPRWINAKPIKNIMDIVGKMNKVTTLCIVSVID